MKHDKYKEGSLAQLSNRRTITLNGSPSFTNWRKSRTLDLVRHPPHNEANVGDMHANASFWVIPNSFPNITATSSPPSSGSYGKKGGGKAWPAALQHDFASQM